MTTFIIDKIHNKLNYPNHKIMTFIEFMNVYFYYWEIEEEEDEELIDVLWEVFDGDGSIKEEETNLIFDLYFAKDDKYPEGIYTIKDPCCRDIYNLRQVLCTVGQNNKRFRNLSLNKPLPVTIKPWSAESLCLYVHTNDSYVEDYLHHRFDRKRYKKY